jgi:hypothetical protein
LWIEFWIGKESCMFFPCSACWLHLCSLIFFHVFYTTVKVL